MAAAYRWLAARFGQAWQARRARDWDGLYALTDPRDREQVPQEQLSAYKWDATQYLSSEVEWVEAVGDRGRVRVRYTVKPNDPNMTKAPAGPSERIEKWVKYEDEWYLDLSPEH